MRCPPIGWPQGPAEGRSLLRPPWLLVGRSAALRITDSKKSPAAAVESLLVALGMLQSNVQKILNTARGTVPFPVWRGLWISLPRWIARFLLIISLCLAVLLRVRGGAAGWVVGSKESVSPPCETRLQIPSKPCVSRFHHVVCFLASRLDLRHPDHSSPITQPLCQDELLPLRRWNDGERPTHR